ncbi:ras-related Rap-2b [Brachionus plicatilis]|uniref:small monomeric GTPase n=1 Tax=Brachionus plicatilis TaxID=10195 RepID=A0A3M7S473_BRAPC|nr:ras-related Rap-2b [Brachionus plicatilis]
MKEYKVVILGPGGVGKSALTVQFISGKFVERYDPTVEDFYRKEIEVDGYPAILEILDTAGTEQFASMRDLYIKNGQGFIIVYSLTSKQSFNDSKLIRDQILRVKGSENVPIVLAANKSDLTGPQREVSTEEGFNLANEWCVPYIETSAKNSTIVNCLFAEIVKEMNLKSNNYYGNKKDRKKSKKLPLPVLDKLNHHNGTNKTSSSDSSYSNSFKETTKFKKSSSGFIKSRLCFGCCRLPQDKSKNCNSSNNNIVEYSFSDKNSRRTDSSCSIL